MTEENQDTLNVHVIVNDKSTLELLIFCVWDAQAKNSMV